MSADSTKRVLAGGGISVLGTLVATITLFDIYHGFALQGDPVVLTFLENALPLFLNLAIVAAGLVIVSKESLQVGFVTRTTKWTLLGAVSLLSMIGWVYYFQVRQGEIKPYILFSHIVSMGAVAGLAVGIYDGQRREREAQLAGERDKILALFENSSDCIAEVEFVDGRPIVREVNPSFLDVFGFERSTIIGHSLDEAIVPEDGASEGAELTERASRGEQFEVENVVRETADGDNRVLTLQVVPFSSTSSTGDIYAVYTDITAEHRYEQRITALHESTRELVTIGSVEGIAEATVTAVKEVLDLHYISVHLYDPDTHRLHSTAYSADVEELLGKPPSFGPGEAIAWDVFESGTARYVEDIHTDPDSYNEDSTIRSELLVPLQGFGVLLIGDEEPHAFDDTDFSLAKILGANVEVAMERAEREAQLEQQNEQLETFTSIVSHDLRNPLGVANGYLELAREGDEEAFERVGTALERMEELIENLLTLARQGEAIDEVMPVSLKAVATRAWNNTETADGRLEIDGQSTIEADPERLQQLFENLFTNAVEHGSTSPSSRTQTDAVEHGSTSPPSHTQEDAVEHGSTSPSSRTQEDAAEDDYDGVTVRVAPTESGFVVEDDGTGIPADDRNKVLEAGYTNSEAGTGFGLSIVQQIVQGHDWTLSVTDGSAGGARFEIADVSFHSS